MDNPPSISLIIAFGSRRTASFELDFMLSRWHQRDWMGFFIPCLSIALVLNVILIHYECTRFKGGGRHHTRSARTPDLSMH